MTVLFICIFAFVINVPMGVWRSGTKRFSPSWFVAVHASVPLIILIRILTDTSAYLIPLFIFAAVFGQLVGGRAGSYVRAGRGADTLCVILTMGMAGVCDFIW